MVLVKEKKGHFLDSQRIYLREVRQSDVTDEYYYWLNDVEVNRYLETRFCPHSKEKIRSYVHAAENDPHTIFWAIVLKDEDQHIGNIKIGGINWFHRTAKLSLFIGERAYWRKGIGTEAIKLAVAFAFNNLNLRKLNAGIYAANVGSIRAFEKAGFVKEGCRREQRYCDGQYLDEFMMGMIRTHKAS